MEVTAFIAAHGDLEDDAGRRRVVRHGHHRAPGSNRHRAGRGALPQGARAGVQERPQDPFHLAILPPYLRRAKSIEELLPWLNLKGISTGDFTEALAALRRTHRGFPRRSRLEGCLARQLGKARNLSARRYLYFWADGIYFQTPDGARQAMHPGHHRRRPVGPQGTAGNRRRLSREAQSWRELLSISSGAASRWRPSWPGDGALGFWKALRETLRRANSAAGCTRPATF